jgi:hypothetical protein
MAAGMVTGAKYESVTASVTITSTPDRSSRSAIIQAPKAPMNCMIIELGTSEKRLTMSPNTKAKAIPAAILPPRTTAKVDATPIAAP